MHTSMTLDFCNI